MGTILNSNKTKHYSCFFKLAIYKLFKYKSPSPFFAVFLCPLCFTALQKSTARFCINKLGNTFAYKYC